MKSFENLLPKLVIAPGFVLGFAFICFGAFLIFQNFGNSAH